MQAGKPFSIKPRLWGQDSKVRLAGLDTAIRWLRDHGVGAERLAGMFQTSPNHIWQLTHRGGLRSQPAPTALLKLHGPPSPELRRLLGIRTHEDSVLLTRRQRAKLDDLSDRFELVRGGLYEDLRKGNALAKLHGLLPEVGYPSHFARLRLLARIQYQIAVAHVHLGQTASALDHGLRSFHISRAALSEGGERLDQLRMADSALLLAQAHQIRQEPDRTIFHLDLHRELTEGVGAELQTEYFRLLGIHLFQIGEDAPAKKTFFEARRRLLRSEILKDSSSQQEAHRLSFQQQIFLHRDWDAARELFQYALDTYPAGYLQIAMNLNWTVACGLSLDSPNARRVALDLLEKHGKAALAFGHQSTVTELLRVTRDLPEDLQGPWIRRAMYENAARDS